MRKFIKISLRRPHSPVLRKAIGILSAGVAVAVAMGFLMLLLPLLGLIFAVILGAVLGICLVSCIWWLLRGQKLLRNLKSDPTNTPDARARPERPRKKIRSKMRDAQP